MHCISSKWRKPVKNKAKRKAAAIANANKRWKKEPSESSSLSLPAIPAMQNLSGSVPSTPSIASNSYTMMEDEMWGKLLQNIPCSECHVTSLNASITQRFGLSSHIAIVCDSCGYSNGKTFSSSRGVSSKEFDVNRKMVHGFLSIGKGQAALDTFSMILGLPTMDHKTFSSHLDALADNYMEVKLEVLTTSRDMVRQQYEKDDISVKDSAVIDVCVSYDGTWQKRGHASLYGIGIVIEVLTGLVIDYEILSKYCHECTLALKDLGSDSAEFAFWYEGHEPLCQKNFTGSSNSMEMEAALRLWRRSVEEVRMKYVKMMSDGDGKAHQHLLEEKVYGPDTTIEKEECINHVAKRLGTALRNKVQEWKVKKITLGGRKKGNLKEETIKKLTSYYRKAIKDNAPNVKKMKAAIFASLHHCMSTDKKPQHVHCPKGKDSWCFFQRACAENKKPKSHTTMKTTLSEQVVEKIMPVYIRLASDELLTKCVAAKTQNANESLHSVIWSKCSKEVFVSKRRLELSVISAISDFNLGCTKSLEIASSANKKEVSDTSFTIAMKKDARRQKQKSKRSTQEFKTERLRKKYCKTSTRKRQEKSEGVTYKAGSF